MTHSEPLVGREALVAGITAFLADQDPHTLAEIRASLEREFDAAGSAALVSLGERLADAGDDWGYYPPDPLARRIHHVLADSLLKADSALVGVEHLTVIAGKPVVIVANHLSYSDANLLEVLLHRAGGAELSNRLTVVAGPKVYSSLKRRFSSLCFGTVKTPQSSAVSTGDAVMNAREVARAARLTIDIALERVRKGDALLVFAEGTRSRTTGLQELLTGVTRYFDVPGTWIVPVAIIGTDALFPIGEDALHPVRVVAHIGRPIEAAELRANTANDRHLMMNWLGLAIAALLPAEFRGIYGDDPNLTRV